VTRVAPFLALWTKELRNLWPLGLLLALFQSGDVLTRPFLERLDQARWERIAGYVDEGDGGTGLAAVLVVLVFLVAYAAFVREHEEGTIELLYTLPVRRLEVFAAKVAAGLGLVWASQLLLLATDAALSAWNPATLSGGHWSPTLAFSLFGLQAAFALIVYGHGLFASVLRRLAAIPYLLFVFAVEAVASAVPAAGALNPVRLLEVRYDGVDLVVPWAALAAHGAVAGLLFVFAYVAWMGPADRLGRVLAALWQASRRAVIGCGVASFVALLGLLAIGVTLGLESSEAEVDATESASQRARFEARRTSTERYDFTYPADLEDRAMALIGAADALHDRVAARLGAAAGPRLFADLTDTSAEHAGIAGWTYLRVGLVGETDPARLARTFAHETAHAFQHRLSDRRLGQAGGVFVEGSAEWVSLEVVPDARLRADHRMAAVASWRRLELRFDALVDDDAFARRANPAAAYALGELFTEALVEACGPNATGEVFRAAALAEADVGRTFWNGALRRIGCDLERVEASFERAIARVEREEAARLEAIPRVRGGVVPAGDAIVAVLDRDLPPGQRVGVFLRRGPDAPDTELVALLAPSTEGRRLRIEVPSVAWPAERFELAFFLLLRAHGWPVSEPWQAARTP
jgi:ABC-type transport system involved in cytochrome c biogenesis permease component